MPNPAVAIAASRAGGWGVLDLEYTKDKSLAVEAMANLCQYAKGGRGVKLDSADSKFFNTILSDLPEGLGVVILTFSHAQRLRRQVAALHRRELTVLLEVTSREQAEIGQSVGVDGVIAKGHEAGGRVGEETTFILLQHLLGHVSLPVFAHGGIGLHSAAACYAGGAAGVVLDWQLTLAKDSPLPEALKSRLALVDGSETICLGNVLGESYRIYARPGLPVLGRVQEAEKRLSAREDVNRANMLACWRDEIYREVGCDSIEENLLLMSQDAALAASLARTFVTVGGIIQAISQTIDVDCLAARRLRSLDEHAPLAASHGTQYPIIQGAMTRVSDTAEFARAVADGGALPFLALALMRKADLEPLLAATQALLGDRPWGVGILGFVPLELRQEQLEAVQAYRPPFALIAGGRPDQARLLEKDGIVTYLHVPSPRLLEMFLQDGATRFVFEGRECGGHVGPRTSFVLWEQMIAALCDYLIARGGGEADRYHVIFAGGIHDAPSAAMVAVMAAPLADLGVRIGVSMGTSYLFTEEAVSTGAIVAGFQEEALASAKTVLFETGPGHAIRCAQTPYRDVFNREKLRLYAEGKPFEEVRATLELMNLGRLRIASKGIAQNPGYRTDPRAPRFVTLDPEEQKLQGMYMIGQVAGLRHDVCTIKDLHHSVTREATARLQQVEALEVSADQGREQQRPSDIAIIGMACLLPKAPDLQTYWQNILNKVDSITEIPKDRWDWELYYDADRLAKDKIYSKWGGFLDEVHFDPLQYGIPPNSLRSIEPLHLLTLEVVRAALTDAGYWDRAFSRERTSVILGAGGGADLGGRYGFRSMLPYFVNSASNDAGERERIVKELSGLLPEWTEDSFAGILTNVAAGRVANRFDLGGRNFTVDAACAASLAAVDLAVRELEEGTSDMVIVGGADTMQSPFAYLCFSKTHALSPRGRCHTFDDSSDGISISEGVGAIILKRLANAERDGDRIYAVIKGVGGSSDGKDKGLTAPRPEGQMRALRRAYAKAGVSPATVELVEAHGTGTAVGDQAEIASLSRVFTESGAALQSCGVGSVKSMIGHTKCTAGVASVIKIALALHHKVLPPTINVEKPNTRANFPDTPFYVNTEARPWIKKHDDLPRRAGVSAFGFGGTNFHAVLEEYTGDFQGHLTRTASARWPSELFLWKAKSRQTLLESLEPLDRALTEATATIELRDLAYTVYEHSRQQPIGGESQMCLAIIAASTQDLRDKLARARQALSQPMNSHIVDPRGIYFTEQPVGREGKIAFLFPGQGSQQLNMLKDLILQFPSMRADLERANLALSDILERPLSSYIFPPPTFTKEEEEAARHALTDTRIAQPALGAVEIGLFNVLDSLGVRPDFVAGHSYGEYVALCAAGALNPRDFIRLSEARGRFIIEGTGAEPGAMAAVECDASTAEELIAEIENVAIANFNSPTQTIISGTRAAIEVALEKISAKGKRAKPISVACAFHSPLMVPAQRPLAAFLASVELGTPQIPVFSNATAGLYQKAPKAIAKQLVEHLIRPVKFLPQIEALYAGGARIFVEVGPGTVLTNRIGEILGDRPHLRVASDQSGRSSVVQLQHLLGQLAAHGLPVELDPLFSGREVRKVDFKSLAAASNGSNRSPITWVVNGTRAQPLAEAITTANQPRSLPSGLRAEPQPSSPLVETKPPRHGPRRIIGSHAPAATSGRMEAAAPSLPVSTPHAGQKEIPLMREQERAAAPIPEQDALQAPPLAHAPIRQEPTLQSTPSGGQFTSPSEVVQVMSGFQDLMRRFLDTQKSVMETFLQNYADGATPTLPAPTGSPRQQIGSMPALPLAEVPAAQATVAVAVNTAATPPQRRVLTPQNGTPLPDVVAVQPVPSEQVPDTRPVVRAEPADSSMVTKASMPLTELPKIPKKEELTAQLVAIVSERTGYPPEMLDLDLDLEADLGIDSIKRIEILGNFQKSFDFTAEDDIAVIMEELAKIKTLRGVVDWVDTRLRAALAGQAGAAEIRSQATEYIDVDAWIESVPQSLPAAPALEYGADLVQRFTLSLTDCPYVARNDTQALAPGRVVILTDDEHGVAESMAAALLDQGHSAALVRMGEYTEAIRPGVYSADLTSPAGVEELLEMIRQRQGPVAGLIHLLPLKEAGVLETEDDEAPYERIQREVKSLFYLSKAASQDLKEAAKQGGACVLAATGMGGMFGSGRASRQPAFFAGQGSVAGFVKTVAWEWPTIRAKVVDTDPTVPAREIAARLLQEVLAGDQEVEVGHTGSRRVVLRPTLSPLNSGQPPALAIDSSWVILLTGGARGITADVARGLAENYRPTLLLVGRTALPSREESAETKGLNSPRDIKAALMEQMRDTGDAIAPSKVEAAYNQLLKEREIRENVHAMESAGATVHYFQVDVSDEHAFGNLIDAIYRDYGRLDGVIHGAGIVEDKLIDDKTSGSFDRVFDTKVRSALVLSHKLKFDSLSCLVFFSSISGRFGNRGQCDYAAANEGLNKLALRLDQRYPGRVVSLNWGPWEGGMVSAELQKQFAQRGVVIVPRMVGRRMMEEEIRWGRKGEVEVLAGGIEAGKLPTPHGQQPIPLDGLKRLPLIGTSTGLSRLEDGSVEFFRTIDPAQDLYLNDHRLDGKPVFPLAMALELMAEAASAGWPGLEVVALKDLRLLRGIVLENGSRQVRVVARPVMHPSDEEMEVEVSIVGVGQRAPAHYKATASLAASLPKPPALGTFSLGQEMSLPFPVDEVYRRWLFHGPLMAGISEVQGIGNDGIAGRIVPSAPERCLLGAPQGSWLIDPVVMDSALQMIIIWSRMQWDMTPLPSRLQVYRRYGPLSGGKITCQLRVRSDTVGHVVHCDWVFVGDDGQVLGLMEDAEGACSKALNRLAQMKDPTNEG
jgi:acyl transferase domain-containing protein/NAD(P)H-dependent flavin oxidoreductase YrpB (nitropropane dioxygenase family)